MKRLLHVMVSLGLLASACRTEITPVLVKPSTEKKYKLVDAKCEVHEYPRGDEVPPGATNIGWVQVERKESDEATFEALREAICAKNGNAFSQARWLRNSGVSVTQPPHALEANAWLLAEPR